MRNTHRINYEDVRQKALEHKPKLIVAGASAYPREIDFKKFREIADEVGAYFMVDMAHIAGLVAADFTKIQFHMQILLRQRHIKRYVVHAAELFL